jgi:hypothetical protein
MAKLIEVIYSEILRGRGVDESPVRVVKQYWTTDGTLLFEIDPHEEQ